MTDEERERYKKPKSYMAHLRKARHDGWVTGEIDAPAYWNEDCAYAVSVDFDAWEPREQPTTCRTCNKAQAVCECELEAWTATMGLRFKGHALQQLWQSGAGKTEWRDVPRGDA